MKRILFVLTVALICLQFPAMAQKARVGIQAGISSSNLKGKVNEVTTDYKSRTGFSIGMLMDAPIGKTNFSFRPSLDYIQKGAVTSKTSTQKEYYALRYAEFAFNFIYSTNQAGDLSAFIGLGPSVSLNLPSKSVSETGGTKVESNLVLDNKGAAVLRGIDYGATGLAGLEIKNQYFLSFNYNLGLRNMVPDSKTALSPSDKLKSHTFGVKLGVLLNNK